MTETEYDRDIREYLEKMQKNVLHKKGKVFDVVDWKTPKYVKEEICCKKQDKYRNIISNNLKFWSCKSCGADLGDINDS